MAYSITGMRRAPDVGFTSATRQTAEGARDLVAAFIADGMHEVEVRDASGTLRTTRELEQAPNVCVGGEPELVARLSAI